MYIAFSQMDQMKWEFCRKRASTLRGMFWHATPTPVQSLTSSGRTSRLEKSSKDANCSSEGQWRISWSIRSTAKQETTERTKSSPPITSHFAFLRTVITKSKSQLNAALHYPLKQRKPMSATTAWFKVVRGFLAHSVSLLKNPFWIWSFSASKFNLEPLLWIQK